MGPGSSPGSDPSWRRGAEEEEVRALNQAGMDHTKHTPTAEPRGFLLPLNTGIFRKFFFAYFLTIYYLKMEDFCCKREMDYKLLGPQPKRTISPVPAQRRVSAA